MGIDPKLGASHRNLAGGVYAGHVVAEIQAKKLGGHGTTIRGCVGLRRADRLHFEWSCPVERELGVEDLGIGASFGALPNGVWGVIDSNAATNDIRGDFVGSIGHRRFAPLDTSNVKGALLVYDLVRATLAVNSQVAVFEVVTIQSLVSTLGNVLENIDGKAGKMVVNPVAALREFLQANSTCGKWVS